MNARPERRLCPWIARAISSLPVPDSPEMKTLASVGRDPRDHGEHLLDALAGPDDVLERVVALELVAELRVVAHELHLLRRPADEDAELGRRERLGDVVVRARADRFDRCCRRSRSR
jgi:hypothetical protein